MIRLTTFFSILLLICSLSEGTRCFCSNSDDCSIVHDWAELTETAYASIATRGYTSQQSMPTGPSQALRSASLLLEKELAGSDLNSEVLVVERFKHRDSDTSVCTQCCLVLAGSRLRRYCSSFEDCIDYSSSIGEEEYCILSILLNDIVSKVDCTLKVKNSLAIHENIPLQTHESMKFSLKNRFIFADIIEVMKMQLLIQLHSTDINDVFIACLEEQGIQLGYHLARIFKVPFVPLTKPGKLRVAALTESHANEFGFTELQIPIEYPKSLAQKQAILVDAFIITGETMRAACTLLERVNKSVALILTVADHPMSRDKRDVVLEGRNVATCL